MHLIGFAGLHCQKKKKTANRYLAVPDDSSVIGERPLSGSDKRLFSPRTCARSLNLERKKKKTVTKLQPCTRTSS